jgi:hypothetical protein
MWKGFDCYNAYMLSLSDSDFLMQKTKPFYLEKGATQAHWLVEEISHFFITVANFSIISNSLAMMLTCSTFMLNEIFN